MPTDFLYGIQCLTTFISNVFSCNSYIFDGVEHQIESTFPFQYNVTFNLWTLWSLLAPLLEEVDMYAHYLLCTEFNAQQLLFQAFSRIIRTFASVEPQSNNAVMLNGAPSPENY